MITNSALPDSAKENLAATAQARDDKHEPVNTRSDQLKVAGVFVTGVVGVFVTGVGAGDVGAGVGAGGVNVGATTAGA